MSYRYALASPTISEEEIDAATAVLRSGRTTMGEKVEQFEEAFARRVGARHAVMVNSGSSADLLIAFALAEHGRVLIPAVTWPTHYWSWKMAGAFPRLIDIGEVNVTAEAIERAVTKDTFAVSLVHLMGVPCDMGPILEVAERYQLVLTEDCCEALGATYEGHHVGTFGTAAAWSFFFSHHITTMEGGMVTTDDEQLSRRLRSLRSHGWARGVTEPLEGLDPRYTFIDQGFNLRPTEVAAAIGLVQLKRCDSFLGVRQASFKAFARAVADNPLVALPSVPLRGRASWFGVPMLVADGHRDDLAAHLEESGIETRPILAGNLVRQPAFSSINGSFPNADVLHDAGLYIGLHDGIEEAAAEVNAFTEAAAVMV